MEERKMEEIKKVEKVEMKICSKCRREFPKTSFYFNSDKHRPDGFTTACKECKNGKRIFDIVVKEGFKNCKKCKHEFPVAIKYFPPDKMCKDGFRNVCRECGKDGHFMDDDYNGKHFWTQEELDLLKYIYPHYTNEEIIETHFPNESLKSLQDRAWELGVKKSEETMNRTRILAGIKNSGENNYGYGKPMPEETKRKLSLSKKGKYVGVNNKLYGVKWDTDDKRRSIVSQTQKGKWSGKATPRAINPLVGKYNGKWRGGVTKLYDELRSELKEWQRESMINCNYKCVLTNMDFDAIHHLHPFSDIMDECFELLNLDIRPLVKDYSEEEFEQIRDMIKSLHNKYGLGVCLRSDVHKLFHDLYGYTKNTKEQFEEFKLNYNKGVYRDSKEEVG